jgi:hypothetical protein
MAVVPEGVKIQFIIIKKKKELVALDRLDLKWNL